MRRQAWTTVLVVGGALALAAVAVFLQVRPPILSTSVTEAKEDVLRDDLFTMRSVIDQYTLDKQKAPQSLQDLVSAGYLKSVPKDPFTGSTGSWKITRDDTIMDPNQSLRGITDVHSGARGTGRDGKPYASW